MNRTEARELLMQMVFQMEAQGDSSDELMKTLYEDHKGIHRRDKEYIEAEFSLIRSHIDDIDELIDKDSERWKASRMPKSDLAVARVAVCELTYCDDIPDAVAINEAVDLAKKFGSSDDSPKFINGLLGKIAREKTCPEKI